MNVFDRPLVRSARWWAFDVLVTLVVVTLSLPAWFQAPSRPGVAGVLAGLAITVPIVLRRVWPVPVLAWIFVVNGLVALWDPHLASGFSLIVALYTVAAWRPRKEAFIAATVFEVGAFVAAVKVDGGRWWFAAIFLTGMVAAAAGLGLYAATRRAYLGELHDRAERLERERDQVHELAVITERARIIREMHDVVAHNLSVIVALSDGAAASAERSPERAAEVMKTVSTTGRQALADTRRLLGIISADGAEDRHPVPDLDGLSALVEQVRTAGLPVSYEVHGAVQPLPTGAQLTVYRLVQEALTNTLKHGGPDAHATVRLRYLPGELRVDVDDDGVGALAVVPTTPGRGLSGMHERVHVFGGTVQSGPRLPTGWRVSAHLRTDESLS